MQDRPDAPELLAALARWLYDDLRPALPREQRFNALVAANACAILAREWVAEGPGAPDRTEQRALARAIRAGEHDGDWDDVVRQVREDVRHKLAVAHPGYDDVADDGKDKES
jgi:Domain of unknown function (DUF6285)